jgi:hypothetical protein
MTAEFLAPGRAKHYQESAEKRTDARLP